MTFSALQVLTAAQLNDFEPNTITTTGDVVVGNDLDVTGDIYNSSGNLSLADNVTVGGGLDVTGGNIDVTSGSITSNGNIYINNTTELTTTASGLYITPSGGSQISGLPIRVGENYNGVGYEQTGASLSAGWYTIAVNSGSRASADFVIDDLTSGRHQTVRFQASHMFGGTRGKLTVTHNNRYASSPPFGQIRMLGGAGVYDGAAIQVYVSATLTDFRVRMMNNTTDSGWRLINWLPAATNPGGVPVWPLGTYSAVSYLTSGWDADFNSNGNTSGYNEGGRGVNTNRVWSRLGGGDLSQRIVGNKPHMYARGLYGTWYTPTTGFLQAESPAGWRWRSATSYQTGQSQIDAAYGTWNSTTGTWTATTGGYYIVIFNTYLTTPGAGNYVHWLLAINDNVAWNGGQTNYNIYGYQGGGYADGVNTSWFVNLGAGDTLRMYMAVGGAPQFYGYYTYLGIVCIDGNLGGVGGVWPS